MNSFSTTGEKTGKPGSLTEMAARIAEPEFAELRAFYRMRRTESLRMVLDEAGWADASAAFGTVRDAVETQSVVFVQSIHLGHEAALNPLRARRAGAPARLDAAELVDRELAEKGCRWCDPKGWHVSQGSRFAEEFGTVSSPDGRFRGIPNWARLAPISGLVYGDERAHNLFRLTESDFVAMFETALSYATRVRAQRPETRYVVTFLNGGAKSAGSVSHAHLQVVGRDDRHFGVAEQVVACCPPDYWQRLAGIHDSLGLATHSGSSIAWANLCPVKERDVTILSPDLTGGARFVYGLLQALIRSGTNSFSLAAILRPEASQDPRFASWPGVVWRFVDRGDMRAAHADIGSLELLGGTSAIATDPWVVAGWLRQDRF